jgi:putative transposase
MDLYSRYIVFWEISTSLEREFCSAALKAALGKGRPEYFNTDQGAQFTSKEFTLILKEEKIRISMEEVYAKCYESVADCKWNLGEYIERYNR